MLLFPPILLSTYTPNLPVASHILQRFGRGYNPKALGKVYFINKKPHQPLFLADRQVSEKSSSLLKFRAFMTATNYISIRIRNVYW